MSGEVTYLPTNGDGAYLGAAGFLAVVAYPDEREKRDRFVDAVKAWHVKRALDVEQDFRNRYRPEYRAWKRRDINKEFSKAHRRITQRLLAAHSCLFRVTDESRQADRWIAVARADKGIRHADSRPIAEAMDTQTTDAKRRVWQPSLPVLHLALALREHLETQPEALQFEVLLDHPQWLVPALNRAEGLRPTVEALWAHPACISLLPK